MRSKHLHRVSLDTLEEGAIERATVEDIGLYSGVVLHHMLNADYVKQGEICGRLELHYKIDIAVRPMVVSGTRAEEDHVGNAASPQVCLQTT